MLEKYEVCCGLFHGFDRSAWTNGSPAERLHLLPAALEHVLATGGRQGALPEGRARAVAKRSPWRCRIPKRSASATTCRCFSTCGRRCRSGPACDAKSDEELDHADAPDRLAGRGPGRRGGHLRRGRTEEAGTCRFCRRSSCVKCAACAGAQPRRRVAGEAFEGRTGDSSSEERSAGALVRRDAGADDPTLPEPRGRGGAQVIEDLIGLARELREANARGGSARAVGR